MNINRRNVLAGLGGLAIGGGALLGSGAFTSVQATRTVEVNVTTGSDIADEYVDVLVYAGDYSTVDVASADPPSSGGSTTDPTTVFPESGDTYDSWTQSGDLEHWVSLIDNDLNIEFGRDSGLPTNSRVSYNPLFAVVNDDNSDNETDNFEFFLEYPDPSNGTTDSNFLEIGGDAKGTSGTLNEGNSVEYNSVVDTGTGSDGDTLPLTIRIEQA